ncbi:MAG: ribosome biogenesis GTPase YlqF [Desulfuromonas sp.]|nr:MAG: ribosome biogenesis GTPase YlqF [Desulfuromonas sp.]
MKIEWYPGHMRSARLKIAEVIPTIDVVIEVLDARLPNASANPVLESLRGQKPCIKILNKNDLADPNVTRQWVQHFEQSRLVRALPLDARNRKEAGQITKLCRQLAPHRGKPGKPLRVIVVGIPNVGKSTLINTLAGRKITRVGDKPAITTAQQQVDLRNGILLADTPGLIWPVMDDPAIAARLAVSGAIGDNAVDYPEMAWYAINMLSARYPDAVKGRYKLAEPNPDPQQQIEQIGRKRGCLAGGGEVDTPRISEIIIRELRGGQLGRVSLETPDDLIPITNEP